jgi:hypothetical protein
MMDKVHKPNDSEEEICQFKIYSEQILCFYLIQTLAFILLHYCVLYIIV